MGPPPRGDAGPRQETGHHEQSDYTDQDKPAPGAPARERFEWFHRMNPRVYDVLVAETRAWRASGRDRAAIDMVFNRARWVLSVETVGDKYRLNDHFRAFYARLIMIREPDLAGVFELRRSVADTWADDLPRQRTGDQA